MHSLKKEQVVSNRLIVLNGNGPNQKELLKITSIWFKIYILGSQSYYTGIIVLLSC